MTDKPQVKTAHVEAILTSVASAIEMLHILSGEQIDILKFEWGEEEDGTPVVLDVKALQEADEDEEIDMSNITGVLQ